MTKNEEREHVAYFFRRSGEKPWLLRERHASYVGLGDERTPDAVHHLRQSTPYTCAGPPVPSFPAICHVSATMYQVKDKSLVDVGSFEGLNLL